MHCTPGSVMNLNMTANELFSGHCHRRQSKLSCLLDRAQHSLTSPSRLLSSALAASFSGGNLIANFKYKPQGFGWEDVLDCIALAKTSYIEKGEESKVRHWARHSNTAASALTTLASMIPDEKGLSVLREGLVLLFQVRSRGQTYDPKLLIVRFPGMANPHEEQRGNPPASRECATYAVTCDRAMENLHAQRKAEDRSSGPLSHSDGLSYCLH